MSWRESRLAQRLGLTVPIVQGPFGGGLSSPVLAATVSNSGGLGSFGAHHLTPAQIGRVAQEIRALTDGPFALNLWVGDRDPGGDHLSEQALEWLRPYCQELGLEMPLPPERYGQLFEEQIPALLEASPAVFSFVYGIPSGPILEECRNRGIFTLGTATSEQEALALEQAGVDAVVASGFEAGGHRVSFLEKAENCLMGSMSLIPRVVDRVTIPVIAAGGIADGRGIVAALALGADAVQIGTAFLACQESAAPQVHREALFSEQAAQTVLTRAFTGRLARGLDNRLSQQQPPLAYPAQAWITGYLKRAAILQGRTDLMSLWAGQSAPLIRHHNAADLITSLRQEVEKAYSAIRPIQVKRA